MKKAPQVKRVTPPYTGMLFGGLALEASRNRRHKHLFEKARSEIQLGRKRGGSAARAYFSIDLSADKMVEKIQPKRKNCMVRRAAGRPTFRQEVAQAKADALKSKKTKKV